MQVPFNAAAYGSNYCGSIVCTRDIGRFLLDQGAAWYDSMVAWMTADEIDEFLAPFDIWDRYDHDGDGDFDEPDGYIDHYQSVHAGEGQEGTGITDQIWSHRSSKTAFRWELTAPSSTASGPIRWCPHRREQLLDRRLHCRA